MITDYELEQVAKALNSESYISANYLAIGTGALTTFGSSQTSITGEVGSRLPLTKTRSGNVLTFQATRSGATVLNTTSGDALTNVGILGPSTAGTVLIGEILGGITQTTAFDIEFTFYLEPVRR